MFKYANVMLKVLPWDGGFVLFGRDPRLSALAGKTVDRVFFVNEKGVHECPRDGKIGEAVAGAVLIDCNPLILEKVKAAALGQESK